MHSILGRAVRAVATLARLQQFELVLRIALNVAAVCRPKPSTEPAARSPAAPRDTSL